MLRKALSNEVGKTERVSQHFSRIDTALAEKEERSVNKSPSLEINAEGNLQTILTYDLILNLSKQIRELHKEHLFTSFQYHRFYSNPDPVRLRSDLPKS